MLIRPDNTAAVFLWRVFVSFSVRNINRSLLPFPVREGIRSHGLRGLIIVKAIILIKDGSVTAWKLKNG
jgi:hypothetical protein